MQKYMLKSRGLRQSHCKTPLPTVMKEVLYSAVNIDA